MPSARGIVFISNMEDVPWGGSEELWSRAALNLAAEGYPVAANVLEWSPLHPRIRHLQQQGVVIATRPQDPSLWQRAVGKLANPHKGIAAARVARLLRARQPDLVVHSCGTSFPTADFAEICQTEQIPFVTVGQSNHDQWWIHDWAA